MTRVDTEKQVAFWRAGAEEDLRSGELLVRNRHDPQGLFFVHLAVEKLLKAHITRITSDVPPRIHSLPALAALSGLRIPARFVPVLAILTRFNISGRYPEDESAILSHRDATQKLRSAKAVFSWLIAQL